MSGSVLIERDSATGSSAVYSTDSQYRYQLSRRWADEAGPAIFAMLNPSTATAFKNDPTIRRCVGYAHEWGCSGVTILNIFAWRSTDPKVLRYLPDPVGPLNEEYIKGVCWGKPVICAWGANGIIKGQAEKFLGWLQEVNATPLVLAMTSKGQPAHPLYLRKGLEPYPMPASERQFK